MHAALLLFETEFGPFKDKEKTSALKKEMIESLKKHGIELTEVHTYFMHEYG